MNRFVVVKSLTRRYGFSIQSPPGITWATGPQRTVGWYRLKSDALKRAEELNRAFCCVRPLYPAGHEEANMAEKVAVAFVQLDSGTVYTVYDFPNSKHPAPKPLPKGKGMTDEEVRDAHEAYLRHLAHDE